MHINFISNAFHNKTMTDNNIKQRLHKTIIMKLTVESENLEKEDIIG